MFKKGDLVFWIGPDGGTVTKEKFWCFVLRVKKATKKRAASAYVISDSHGSNHDLDELVHATEQEIVEHDLKRWGHSPEQTKNSIATARRMLTK